MGHIQDCSLVEMSFYGAVLIIAIMMIRAAAVNKLPKKTFLILWSIVLIRLLFPFSVSSVCSVYSFVERGMPAAGFAGQQAADHILQALPDETGEDIQEPAEGQPPQWENTGVSAVREEKTAANVWFWVWCVGAAACGMFFILSYVRCRLEFGTSLPVSEPFVTEWILEHKLRRHIFVRQSDRIDAPLTYGVLKPVILLPKKTDFTDTGRLNYILLHEYVHICRFDTMVKLVMAIAFCIHWFNPFVWVMYLFFGRDMELACDESVVRRMGETDKAVYARLLIGMEAEKSGLMPLCNGFSKNAIEERITAIMKIKKISLWGLLAAVVIVVVVTVGLATSRAVKVPYSEYPEYFRPILEQRETAQEKGPVLCLGADEGIKMNYNSAKPEDVEAGYNSVDGGGTPENGYVYKIDWLKTKEGILLRDITIDLSAYSLADRSYQGWEVYWYHDGCFYDSERGMVILTFDVSQMASYEDYEGPLWLIVELKPEAPQEYQVTEVCDINQMLWFTAAFRIGDFIFDGGATLAQGLPVSFNYVTKEICDGKAAEKTIREALAGFLEAYAETEEEPSLLLIQISAVVEDVVVYAGIVQKDEGGRALQSVYAAFRGDELLHVMTIDEVTGEITIQ